MLTISRQSPSQSSKPDRRPTSRGPWQSSPVSLLLCGGGTGGHVYPALAVASALAARSSPAVEPPSRDGGASRRTQAGEAPARVQSASEKLEVAAFRSPRPLPGGDEAEAGYGDIRLIYVGSVGGMEQAIVERESTLPFRAIRAAAVRGRGPIQLARSTNAIAAGLRQARRLLREERPAAILGTGGYVCVPLFLAARAARIPTMIYLPDIVPGLAVRALAPIATRVACSFEPSLRWLPREKTIVTGYPVRPEIAELDAATSRAELGLPPPGGHTLPLLLVYGGSRGARSINRAIAKLLDPLLRISEILHICGREGDEIFLDEAAQQLPPELRARYHLHPYLQGTMPQALAAADLAICRAGASTLAELPAAALPAVLIPLSQVHQDENAAYLTDRGAAVTVADGAMLGAGDPVDGPLFQAVSRLLTSRQERATMAARSRALARLDAADRLAGALLDLVG